MSRLTLCLLLLTPVLALPDEELRDDFNSVSEWTAHPHRLGAPAETPSLEVADGVAHFGIT